MKREKCQKRIISRVRFAGGSNSPQAVSGFPPFARPNLACKFSLATFHLQMLAEQSYPLPGHDTCLCRSSYSLLSCLHKFGSGQRSSGVRAFLFFSFRSAPFCTRKQAMVDGPLFSWSCPFNPINNLSKSLTCCNCLIWLSV